MHLSSIATVQSFLRNEKRNQKTYSSEQKLELLESVAGKSLPDAQRVLTAISPLSVPMETEKVLTPEKTEISFVANRELLEKFDRLKNRMAHKNAHWSYAEFFDELANMAIKKLKMDDGGHEGIVYKKVIEKEVNANLVREFSVTAQSSIESPISSDQRVEAKKQTNSIISTRWGNAENKTQSNYIPVANRRTAWKESSGRCTYINPKTGRRCEARKFLQIEHCYPKALGCSNEIGNLRILCATHNRLMALQVFGSRKITEVLRDVSRVK